MLRRDDICLVRRAEHIGSLGTCVRGGMGGRIKSKYVLVMFFCRIVVPRVGPHIAKGFASLWKGI